MRKREETRKEISKLEILLAGFAGGFEMGFTGDVRGKNAATSLSADLRSDSYFSENVSEYALVSGVAAGTAAGGGSRVTVRMALRGGYGDIRNNFCYERYLKRERNYGPERERFAARTLFLLTSERSTDFPASTAFLELRGKPGFVFESFADKAGFREEEERRDLKTLIGKCAAAVPFIADSTDFYADTERKTAARGSVLEALILGGNDFLRELSAVLKNGKDPRPIIHLGLTLAPPGSGEEERLFRMAEKRGGTTACREAFYGAVNAMLSPAAAEALEQEIASRGRPSIGYGADPSL